MSDIMWSHENSTLEFRQGVREGMELAIKTVELLVKEIKDDHRITEATWVNVAKTWIEDELSMYEVGDEE